MNIIWHLIKDSLIGWVRHRSVTLPTLLTMGLCTFILIGALLILQNIWAFSFQQEDRWKVEVFLETGSDSEIEQWKRELTKLPAVSVVKYYSIEDAWRRFQKDFGKELLRELESNPLPASFEFVIDSKWRSSYKMDRLLAQLEEFKWTDEVSSSSETLQLMESWGLKIKLGMTVIILFLMLLIWVILRNSVRMSLYSRELIVENMKYIGAEEWAIAFPFLLETILQSALSVTISYGFWYLIGLFLGHNLPLVSEVFTVSWSLYPWIFGAIAWVGILTAWQAVKLNLRENWEG